VSWLLVWGQLNRPRRFATETPTQTVGISSRCRCAFGRGVTPKQAPARYRVSNGSDRYWSDRADRWNRTVLAGVLTGGARRPREMSTIPSWRPMTPRDKQYDPQRLRNTLIIRTSVIIDLWSLNEARTCRFAGDCGLEIRYGAARILPTAPHSRAGQRASQCSTHNKMSGLGQARRFESVMVMSACPQPSDYSLVDQGWFSCRTLHRRRHDWSANTSGKCLARKAQNKSTRWSRTTSICEVVWVCGVERWIAPLPRRNSAL